MDEQHAGDAGSHSELPAFLQPLLDRLHSTAKVETVFGPSRNEHGRTIVPVARVAYGLGGGAGGPGNKRSKHEGAEQQPDEGAGGGGGINVTPLGVVEVTDAGTRFVPLTAPKVTAGAFLAGLLLGVVVSRSGRH